MDTNKMREQFEAAYMRDLVGNSLSAACDWLERGSDGEYRSFQARGAWWSWQASREAVVVELPSRPHASEEEQERMTDYEIGLGHGGCEEWDKIRDKIKAQGLKVAP